MIQPYSCFILAGGKSSRFGKNKSLAIVGGQQMALVVANNLQAAFDCAAQLVGADDQTSREVGLVSFSGPREGNGPLAAIVDSMECSESPLVAFAPNDTPFFTENDFAALRSKMDGVNTDVVVAVDDSNDAHAHWLLSIWSISSCLPTLLKEYDRGVRSVHGAVSELRVATVAFDAASVRNINAVLDLPEQGTI